VQSSSSYVLSHVMTRTSANVEYCRESPGSCWRTILSNTQFVHMFEFEEETEIAAEPIRVDACGLLGLGPL
jgi:hypothetical protein